MTMMYIAEVECAECAGSLKATSVTWWLLVVSLFHAVWKIVLLGCIKNNRPRSFHQSKSCGFKRSVLGTFELYKTSNMDKTSNIFGHKSFFRLTLLRV